MNINKGNIDIVEDFIVLITIIFLTSLTILITVNLISTLGFFYFASSLSVGDVSPLMFLSITICLVVCTIFLIKDFRDEEEWDEIQFIK